MANDDKELDDINSPDPSPERKRKRFNNELTGIHEDGRPDQGIQVGGEGQYVKYYPTQTGEIERSSVMNDREENFEEDKEENLEEDNQESYEDFVEDNKEDDDEEYYENLRDGELYRAAGLDAMTASATKPQPESSNELDEEDRLRMGLG